MGKLGVGKVGVKKVGVKKAGVKKAGVKKIAAMSLLWAPRHFSLTPCAADRYSGSLA